jgi:hypothetical protein
MMIQKGHKKNAQERWEFINTLDEEYLKGGVILSEWCAFIVRSSDKAFGAGAFLASILTAVAGIETYLRSQGGQITRRTFSQLIDECSLDQTQIEDLHDLRRYRNRWVHVNDPWDDVSLIDEPEKHESELEDMAISAARLHNIMSKPSPAIGANVLTNEASWCSLRTNASNIDPFMHCDA